MTPKSLKENLNGKQINIFFMLEWWCIIWILVNVLICYNCLKYKNVLLFKANSH